MKAVRNSLGPQIWRAIVLLGIGISAFLAVHDFLGYKDANPVVDIPTSPYHPFFAVIRILMVAIAATIALTRYDRRDARTLCAALLGLSLNNYWWWYSQTDILFWPVVVLNYVGIALGVSNFVRFASTYGPGDWRGLRKVISWTPPFFFAAMSVSGSLFIVLSLTSSSDSPILNQLFWLLWDAANVLIMVASFTAWKQALPSESTSMAIVAVTFAIFTSGTALHGIDRIFQSDTLWANNVDACAQAALPIGLGYVILRHRFLDIRFVINQAIIYALLGSLIVGVFNLAGKLVNNFIASLNLSAISGAQTRQLTEASASLAVAAALPKLQQWASHLVRAFVFRGRDLDLAVLKRFGQTIDVGATEQDIIEQVAVTLKTHAHVIASCLYLEEADGNLRPRGSTFSEALPPLDGRALWDALKTHHADSLTAREIDPDLPEGKLFPVLARSRVRGMLLCAEGNETLATNEQVVIRDMVNAAVLAIDDARLERASTSTMA